MFLVSVNRWWVDFDYFYLVRDPICPFFPLSRWDSCSLDWATVGVERISIELLNCRQSVDMFQNTKWPFFYFFVWHWEKKDSKRKGKTERERKKENGKEIWSKLIIDINLFLLVYSPSLSSSIIISFFFVSPWLVLPLMNRHISREDVHRRRRGSGQWILSIHSFHVIRGIDFSIITFVCLSLLSDQWVESWYISCSNRQLS